MKKTNKIQAREYYWLQINDTWIIGERNPDFIPGSKITTSDSFSCCFGNVSGSKIQQYIVELIKMPLL